MTNPKDNDEMRLRPVNPGLTGMRINKARGQDWRTGKGMPKRCQIKPRWYVYSPAGAKLPRPREYKGRQVITYWELGMMFAVWADSWASRKRITIRSIIDTWGVDKRTAEAWQWKWRVATGRDYPRYGKRTNITPEGVRRPRSKGGILSRANTREELDWPDFGPYIVEPDVKAAILAAIEAERGAKDDPAT